MCIRDSLIISSKPLFLSRITNTKHTIISQHIFPFRNSLIIQNTRNLSFSDCCKTLVNFFLSVSVLARNTWRLAPSFSCLIRFFATHHSSRPVSPIVMTISQFQHHGTLALVGHKCVRIPMVYPCFAQTRTQTTNNSRAKDKNKNIAAKPCDRQV